jgi:hypothetical protein
MSVLQRHKMVYVKLAGIGIDDSRIRIPPSAGENAAVPRINKENRRHRLLDQHLLSGVLAIAIGVDPMLPVVAVVGGDRSRFGWRRGNGASAGGGDKHHENEDDVDEAASCFDWQNLSSKRGVALKPIPLVLGPPNSEVLQDKRPRIGQIAVSQDLRFPTNALAVKPEFASPGYIFLAN